MKRLCLPLLLLSLAACRHVPSTRGADVETEVRAVLEKQAREWNAGNLAGFMETYAPGEATRFASGGSVTRGWQTVFDRYRGNYNSRAKMGTLTFADLEITVTGPDTVIAFGRFLLKRETDAPTGLFTLTLRRLPQGWRIIQDHTSAEAKP